MKPAPVLLGHGDLLRLSIRTMPFQQKYRSGVLSFAPGDVDVAAFNAGDVQLRWQVDLAIRLMLDIAFAGVSRMSRPMTYITTHTHVGRLEVETSPRPGVCPVPMARCAASTRITPTARAGRSGAPFAIS